MVEVLLVVVAVVCVEIAKCSGKGEIIDWICCVSNSQPSDYTQI